MHTCSPGDAEMGGRDGWVHGHVVIFQANERPCFKQKVNDTCISRVENTGAGKDALVPRVWLFQGIE